MSTETPTKPLSSILSRLLMALVVVVVAYYGYHISQNEKGFGATLLMILSALAVFIGLVVFYRALMELINRGKRKSVS